VTTRNVHPWLLLDPPSSKGYARRGSLREKTDAPDAPFPSIDLILMSGRIREAGYHVVYIDAQLRGWGWDRLAAECRRIRPIGILSLVTSSRTDEELEALGHLKLAIGGEHREAARQEPRPSETYVIGSVHRVLAPDGCRRTLERHPRLDGIVVNTAENNFGELIAAPGVAPHNVAVRRGGEIIAEPVSVTYGDGLRIARPAHEVFKDPRYYFPQSKRRPVTCVQMSVGCPYTCEFCLDNALYRKMNYRHVDDVIDELVEIDRFGFRECYFKDLTFGLNKKITTELLEKLAVRSLNLRWLCTTRVDVATPRLLGLMKKAGCYGIEFGVESGVRHRRAANGKPIDDDDVREVFANCRRSGIETTAFVMIGFEDETEAEIRTTMRFVESLHPDYASYNVVTALPGSPLHARARREGFLREADSDYTYLTSNIRHRHLTPQQLQSLHAEAVASFYRRPSLVTRRLLNVRSFFELRKLVKLSRVAL